ncbi:MAG: murein biosynthesis integral membrane protein MurJ [Vicinamibacteria bacterium]|nr:murein biosynthesis integral membrane protein MurJ [Vicinamibacteria bacterium]
MSHPVKDGSPSLARSATLVSSMVGVSRVMGLVREQVFAALLGAGPYSDAFRIAFRIPNLVRDLFAEGALSAALVPTYAATVEKEGLPAAHRLASRLFTLLAVGLGLLVVLGWFCADTIVALIAPGFADVPGKAELATRLTRVMLPFLPMVSFAAVAMGMLNARGRFGLPAFAPAMFNVVSVAMGLALWLAGFEGASVAFGWAIGTLLGGAAQFLVQWPALRAEGFRLRPEWSPADPGVRRIGALMAPATVGLAAVQVNVFVSSNFASEIPGAVSWLEYAFRLLYLPLGIFGVAIATVAASGLSRQVAQGDHEAAARTLRQGLRFALFLTLPATVGLMVLREPIVRLIYERGRFSAEDTREVAAALLVYALGLCALTAVKVVAPAFYAAGEPRVPLAGSLAAIATNLAVMVAGWGQLGHLAVALGMSAGGFVNAAVLVVMQQRRRGGLLGHGMAGAGLKMAGASVLMGGAALAAAAGLELWIGGAGLGRQAVVTLGGVAAGVAVYAGAALALRLPEATLAAQAVGRRLARS